MLPMWARSGRTRTTTRMLAVSTAAMIGAVAWAPASSLASAPRSSADGALGSWSALGTGAANTGGVYALARDSSGRLFAAGNFTTMNGLTVNNIAVWNGASWSALGSGLNSNAMGMAISPDDSVYVGGNFTQAGGVPASQVASWNGTSWSALGSGLDAYARDFAFPSTGQVFTVGDFSQAGGQPANGAATWSSGTWTGVGNFSFNAQIYAAVALPDDSVVVGGALTDASGVADADNIARWNGSSWSAVGGPADSWVMALDLGSDGSLYAGGIFTSIDGVSASRVARFDGTSWHPLGSGLPNEVRSLLVDDTHGLVYAGGFFTDAAAGTNRIAVWDAGLEEWIGLRSPSTAGLNDLVVSLEFADDSHSSVVAGGTFTDAGGLSGGDGIARWTWDPPTGANAVTASPGDVVTLTGWGLIGIPATGAMSIGGIAATYTRDDSTTIRATVPAGVSGTVPIVVTAVGGTASIGTLTVPVPPPPAPTPATAPLSVSAVAGDASASVSWRAPASTGSYPISTYQAVSSPGGHSCLVAAPALTCEVTGLSNGTAYTFTVRALTGAGWSAASEPSNAVTPEAAVRPSVVITGSRVGERVEIAGKTTGFGMGGTLRPWLRFPGQSAYSEGSATILVSMDGTFEWGRRTGKRVSVYVQTPDGSVRSNVVIIR